MNAVEELNARLSRLWAPPREISTSEWADAYAVLSPETAAEPGRWKTRSYQREPMDATSDPTVRRVVVKSATQVLKSSVIKNAVARAIDVDPGPIMVLLPRKEDAREFMDDHMGPMVRDTEKLRGKIRLSKHGKAPKQFRGGRLIVTSAGSEGNVAGKAIRYLFCDEVDKYPASAGDEGNPISLARKRLVSFLHRAKEIDTCSPTLPDSEIDRAYEMSDQREFYIPCPHCGFHQSLMKKWHRVRWDETLETREQQAFSARYYCEACEQPWDDAGRWAAVNRGVWKARKAFNGIAGFWLSELYSLQRKLREIVLDYLQKKDNPNDLRTFVNTTLAENWVDKGDAPEWEILLNRREDYPVGVVPRGGLAVVGGADVHPDRIEVERVAWGRRKQTWSIEYKIFEGNTAELLGPPGKASPWEMLTSYIAELSPCEGGGDLPLELLCIDSGDQAQIVYEWVRQQRPGQVVAIKGVDRGHLPVSQPSPVDLNRFGRTIKSGLKIRKVLVSFFKAQLYSDLKKRRPTDEERGRGWPHPEGYCHFPQGENYGDEHFKQICAEQQVTVSQRNGRVRQEWQKLRARNEALDCRIYAMAAAWLRGIYRFTERHWAQREVELGPNQAGFELAPPADAGVAPVTAQEERLVPTQALARALPKVSPQLLGRVFRASKSRFV